MAAIGEYYQILGVAADAGQDDIKKAFRKLARTCHPDVAGDDPESAENFGRIREAYETLADPGRRAKYDRREQRMGDREGGAHIRSEWRPPGGWDGFSGHSKVRAARRTAHQKSDITLDDIFTQPSGGRADFGFGTQKSDRHSAGSDAMSEIGLNIEVLGRTARLGGTVTVRYKRRRRSSDGVNVYSYDEIHDLRVPPRSCTGDVLRSDRMGHFSTTTNRYGDLVSKLTVLEESGRHHPRRDAPSSVPPTGSESTPRKATPGKDHSDSVRISLVEAVLGGRVGVETPKGPVNVSIPPGTSSGKVLRLKGKGEAGGDWLVRIEIAIPVGLDDESRALISRFGELNPMDLSKD
jgi:curved DNA-binding protein